MTETAKGAGVVAVITRVENFDSTSVAAIANWLVNVMMAGAKSPGFWSGEIITPDGLTHTDWQLIQRFKDGEQARAWRESSVRLRLIEDFRTQWKGGKPGLSDEIAQYDSGFGHVATAIVTDVKPGMEEKYFAWETKIQDAQARFPGYRGSYLQPPAPGRSGQWATLLRFDKPDSLEKWFASSERQALLKESAEFVKATRFQSLSNSFPGWFPVDEETGEGPANWKTAMLVLLGLFPVVAVEIRFLNPLLKELNQTLGTFMSLVLSVVATSYGTMPLFIKSFRWWLFPGKDDPDYINFQGTLVIIALYAVEIALLWTLLPVRR